MGPGHGSVNAGRDLDAVVHEIARDGINRRHPAQCPCRGNEGGDHEPDSTVQELKHAAFYTWATGTY